MKKTRSYIFTLFITLVVCMCGISTTAFAGGGDIQSTPSEHQQPISLTPDGNLTLVDDINGKQAEDKQFVTMQSKNGNYFYLVIDRADDKENVYFLNLVDEADLMALIEDAPVAPPITPECSCDNRCVVGSINTDCSMCVANMNACIGIGNKATEPITTEDTSSNPFGIIIIVLIIALLGGAVYYYLKIMKPKHQSKGSTNLDEYEFDDDDEEYQFTENIQDDTEEKDGEM